MRESLLISDDKSLDPATGAMLHLTCDDPVWWSLGAMSDVYLCQWPQTFSPYLLRGSHVCWDDTVIIWALLTYWSIWSPPSPLTHDPHLCQCHSPWAPPSCPSLSCRSPPPGSPRPRGGGRIEGVGLQVNGRGRGRVRGACNTLATFTWRKYSQIIDHHYTDQRKLTWSSSRSHWDCYWWYWGRKWRWWIWNQG